MGFWFHSSLQRTARLQAAALLPAPAPVPAPSAPFRTVSAPRSDPPGQNCQRCCPPRESSQVDGVPLFLKKRSFLVMRLQRSQSKINPFCFKFPKCFFFNVSLMFFFWVTFSKSVFSVSFFLQTIAPKAVKLWRGPWTQPQPKPRQPQPDRKPCSQPQPH